VTIAKYKEEARAALMDMIPECSYKYGVDATGWFISDAISAFQAIKWDPAKKTTVSEFDEEAAAMVAEDIFGMGDDWLKDTGTPHRPSAPEEYNTNEKTPRTAAALLAKQTDKRTDASSFGSMYNRNHDGDTVQTTLSAAASMQSRASGLSIVNGVEVVDLATASNGGDSGTAHTTKSTKATTAALRIEVEQQRKESQKLHEALKKEREALASERAQIRKEAEAVADERAQARHEAEVVRQQLLETQELFRKMQACQNITPPSAPTGNAGTAADSVGHNT